MFYLPSDHPFAQRTSLTLEDMNGENILLYEKIGFWYDIVASKMPESKFLMQNERYTFSELIANSILPCFVSDISMQIEENSYKNRICVPITDPEVNVSYYLICKKENRDRFSSLFR
jgi:hypothetical protein